MAVIGIGAVIILTGAELVALNVIVESCDALLMPATLLLLWMLASGPALPPGARLEGWHKWGTLVLFLIVSVVAWVSFAWAVGEGDYIDSSRLLI